MEVVEYGPGRVIAEMGIPHRTHRHQPEDVDGSKANGDESQLKSLGDCTYDLGSALHLLVDRRLDHIVSEQTESEVVIRADDARDTADACHEKVQVLDAGRNRFLRTARLSELLLDKFACLH